MKKFYVAVKVQAGITGEYGNGSENNWLEIRVPVEATSPNDAIKVFKDALCHVIANAQWDSEIGKTTSGSENTADAT